MSGMWNDHAMRKIVSILILTGLMISLGLWLVTYTVVGWSNGRIIISLPGGAIRCVAFPDNGAIPEQGEWWWSGFKGFRTTFMPIYDRNSAGTMGLVLPMWMPIVLFAMALWICRRIVYWRRRRRKRFGQCLNCSYDLTGNEIEGNQRQGEGEPARLRAAAHASAT